MVPIAAPGEVIGDVTVQHIAGCSGARNLVAINKDPDANIFKHARYGVVGDWKQVLPSFTAKVKELRGR